MPTCVGMTTACRDYTRRPLRAAMSDDSESIEGDELDGLFARLFADRPHMRCAVAVSGGSDSTALMVLLAEWIAQGTGKGTRQRTGQGTEQAGRSLDACTVLTVDHRLRPEFGRRGAGRRPPGLRARAAPRHPRVGGRQTQDWPAGRRPCRPLPPDGRVRARPRYRPHPDRAHRGRPGRDAAHAARARQRPRRARRHGTDRSPARMAESLLIARPLLDVAKTRLQASLRRRGIGWIEDPSNASPVFERVRLRAARAALESLGLTPGMLGLSARRLRQAAIRARPLGGRCARSRRRHGRGAPVRLLQHRPQPAPCVARRDHRPRADPRHRRGGRSRRAGAARRCGGDPGRPVHRARKPARGRWPAPRLAATPERLLIEREPGRDALPVLALAPGEAAIWDGRFRVSAGPSIDHPVQVRALGVDGVRELRSRIDVPAGLPVGSLRAVASFWRGEQLLAVPPLGFRARARTSSTWRPPSCRSPHARAPRLEAATGRPCRARPSARQSRLTRFTRPRASATLALGSLPPRGAGPRPPP